MAESILGLSVISFLHQIFTILWIGGMSFMLFIYLPASMKTITDKKLRKALNDTISKRLAILAIISIISVTITGLIMAIRIVSLEAIFNFSTDYNSILSIKIIIVTIMIIIALFRQYAMDRIVGKMSPKKKKYNFILLVINIIFGWIVIFLSSYMALLNTTG